MNVKGVPVKTVKWFGHECGMIAELVCDLLGYEVKKYGAIGAAKGIYWFQVYLVLRRGDLMVCFLKIYTA